MKPSTHDHNSLVAAVLARAAQRVDDLLADGMTESKAILAAAVDGLDDVEIGARADVVTTVHAFVARLRNGDFRFAGTLKSAFGRAATAALALPPLRAERPP